MQCLNDLGHSCIEPADMVAPPAGGETAGRQLQAAPVRKVISKPKGAGPLEAFVVLGSRTDQDNERNPVLELRGELVGSLCGRCFG